MTRFLLVLALALSACQSAPESSESADMAMAVEMAPVEAPSAGASVSDAQAQRMADAPAPPADPQADAQASAVPASRVLIRTADLRLNVDDYRAARVEVSRIARQTGAFVSGESERRLPYEVSNTITLRVPSARFDTLMAALVALDGDVEARTVGVEDVTEQSADLESRLRARRAVEARYVEILGRAGSVEDVLAVEARLAETRESIEVLEGQLRGLRDRVALSTVNLTLTEASATGITAGPGFFSRLGAAFGTGWEVLLGLVVGLVAVWPLLIVAGIGVALWLRWRARRRGARIDG